ncbi:MARVEL domain-containing protein 3-like isoform X1 [Scyliorhinus canicula]|uniref:MARVEL domain-containing protein 3-like isoform X1 n=1 Tax=Scyliorhinus canicula TaxID=7830 RepID=UPI0018F6A1D1|nr:MARVEL domain-containing protein 3-like isoform X1 [Scyliorhinus canicula]XP_038652652.1 MARVEL domain-containing protein 3-like isoform X1 [Scyliorhinus canicula]
MPDSNKVPRSTDRSRPSNRPHRERRHPDHPSAENNHSGRRSREDRREPRESHQTKPNPSRQSYPSSERYDPQGESYSTPPSLRLPLSQPNSRPPSSSPPYYTSASPTSTPPKESFGKKCSYLCSRRGLLQMVEIILNLVVLICAAATQSASAGFDSIGGFGSAYYYNMGYANSGFLNHEIQQIGELDVLYNKMKSATVYCAVGLSVILFAFAVAFLVGGWVTQHNRSSMQPGTLSSFLIVECVAKALSAVAYIIGVALYLHFIHKINATDMCKRRESLYNRHGYSSVKCAILGTEVAVSIFAVLLIVVYIAGVVFATLAYRQMRATQTEYTKSPGASTVHRHATTPEMVPMKPDLSYI